MKALRWIGKIAAVLSALILGSAFVAFRSSPGLLQNVQVFGGEGGGGNLTASPEGSGSAAETGPIRETFGSTKSDGIVNSADYALWANSASGSTVQPSPSPPVANVPAEVYMGSSKSGAIFTPPPPPAPWKPIVLSDGTVIQVPGNRGLILSGPAIIDGSLHPAGMADDPLSLYLPGLDLQQPARVPSRQRSLRNQPNQVPSRQRLPNSSANQAPAQQRAGPPPRPPEIMPSSKSAPIFLYNGQQTFAPETGNGNPSGRP